MQTLALIMTILYFVLLLAASIKNLKWGVLWTIFTLPIYLLRLKIFGLPTTFLEIQILLLFLIFVIQNFKNNKFVKFTKIFKHSKLLVVSWGFFIATSIISIFVSPNFLTALGLWRAYFLEPILFFIIFISVIKKEDLEWVFKCLSVSVLCLSLFAILQKFTGIFIANPFWQAEATRRVTSIFPYPNALALYLAPIVVLLIGWLVSKFSKKNIALLLFYFITIITGLLAIYFTQSKGAMLAILAGIIFYAIFFKGYRKIFAIIFFIAIIVGVSFVAVNPNLMKGTSTIKGGGSISTRLEMWQETWQMLKTCPFFGAGLAGYQTAVAQFHQKDYIEIYLYPHNIFLNFWSEIGIIGLLAFLGTIIWFYKTSFIETQHVASLPCVFAAGMTTLLVHGLVDVPYFKNDLAILFWLIVGMLLILNLYVNSTSTT